MNNNQTIAYSWFTTKQVHINKKKAELVLVDKSMNGLEDLKKKE